VRAANYARVSREDQLEGYSIEAQLEAMRRFCKERDWTIVAEYVEPGFTARTDQRPVFLEVMAACERKEMDVLVTHKLDRAYRSLLDQLNRLSQLASWGITYVSVVEQIDYTTPHGRMFMAMLGALNQYFSDNLGLEVRKGKVQRARAGKSNFSTTPYAYLHNERGEDVPDPDLAPAVTLAFETYATGQYTDQEIADLLNQRGVTDSRREE
jgi:site-specific DNA recombinase